MAAAGAMGKSMGATEASAKPEEQIQIPPFQVSKQECINQFS